MTAFIYDVPALFQRRIVAGKCTAVWLPGEIRGELHQFTISICHGCDKFSTIPQTYEVTEVEAENLGAFIQYYWNAAGFPSKQDAVSYYGMEYPDFYVVDGFTYKFRRVWP